MCDAQELIEALVEGAHVTKRVGTKGDSYGWSYETPTLVWDVTVVGDYGGQIVWFDNFSDEGPTGVQASMIDATGDYNFGAKLVARNPGEAERQASNFIKAINAAVSAASPAEFAHRLTMFVPPGFNHL